MSFNVPLLLYKAIAALLIFLASMATVFYPLRKKTVASHTESIEVGEALASGIFLGAALFHMLPDSIKLFARVYGNLTYPLPEMVCVFGFLLLLFLERTSLSNTHHSKNAVPYILSLILIIHALTEGAALGIGANFSETVMLFIAILAHKGSESYALCLTLLRHQLTFKTVIVIILFFALMTPLGIGLGSALNYSLHADRGEWIAAYFNAFAAGTFLYISTLHHIHFHKHERDTQGLVEFASLVMGAVLMGVIAIWT